MGDQWLNIKDAAPAVGVSVATVRRYIRAGDVILRLGLVRLSEVQEAERDARRRRESGRKEGGARGDWLRKKADAFFAERGLDDAEKRIVGAFIEHART